MSTVVALLCSSDTVYLVLKPSQFLTGILDVDGQALLRRSNTLLPAGIELGIWTSAGYLTQALGLMTTDASRASFISTFTVRPSMPPPSQCAFLALTVGFIMPPH